jgi:diguanylate cyclase
MVALTSSRTLSWNEFAFAAAGATAGAIAVVLILGFNLGGDRFAIGVDDIGSGIAALIAAAACAYTSTRSVGRFKRGWALMAASAAAWSIGEFIWSAYEVVLNLAVPFPSAADVGYLLAVPLAIAGILFFWTAPRGTAQRWRLWLDGLTIVLALTFTGWSFGLQQVELSSGTVTERAILLAYPVGDILIAALLILGIRRATRIQHGRMLLLLAGLAANAVADTAFAYMTADGVYPTLLIDSAWVVGFLVIALAALWPAEAPDRTADDKPVDLWQIALPWAAVLTAGASALFLVLRGQRTDDFQSVLAVAMVSLLAISEVAIPWWVTWRAGPSSDPHLDRFL